MASHDIPMPRSLVCADAVEAGEKAIQLGFPVALKILSPQASHKTEVGGVATNLRDPEQVRNEAVNMTARLRRATPEARIDGFLLQEMVIGTEFIIGARDDPQYGPIMLAGLGGVSVEVFQDVRIQLLPIDESIAMEMVSSLKGRALLGQFRGQSARDVGALVKAMVGLSRMFLNHRRWISDLEINPLIIQAEGMGVSAVDVRVVPRASQGG
jgi:acetyltransferase